MTEMPVTWEQPDDELEDLIGPDTDLMDQEPEQPTPTDFFWEDDEEYLNDLMNGVEADRIVQVSDGPDGLAVVFDCGMGDGWYPVLVGKDQAGEASAVLLDLELIHHTTPIPSGS